MISKPSWKELKENFGVAMRITAVYVFILACTLLINILAPITILLTLPFLVLPFTFAYISSIGSLPIIKTIPVRSFLVMYPLYFNGMFFGGFRALLGFAKAILICVVVSSIMMIILFYTYLRGQPGFAEILKEIDTASSVKEMETAMAHFTSFEPMVNATNASTLVGGVLGVWIFIRHCLLNSEKISLNLLNKTPTPMKALNPLYVSAAHLRRKTFRKVYYGATWYVILAFFVFFGGGASLSLYVFHLDASRSIYVGLFFALVLLIVFIPYYFIVIKNICVASADDYQNAMINLSERLLNDLKRKNQISEAEIKQLEDDINQKKAALAQLEKELEKEEEENKK